MLYLFIFFLKSSFELYLRNNVLFIYWPCWLFTAAGWLSLAVACGSYSLVVLLSLLVLVASLFANGEGNGTPHQYSCLENPMDGGAW